MPGLEEHALLAQLVQMQRKSTIIIQLINVMALLLYTTTYLEFILDLLTVSKILLCDRRQIVYCFSEVHHSNLNCR